MSTDRASRPRYDSMKSSASSVAPSTWGAGVRPPSPSFSTTTTGSKVNLPAAHLLISRKDLRQSIACFEELMTAAKAYRNALLAMSTATAAFATAMEACSRLKGCRASNGPLAGASGLQYLMSNHEQILADTVYRQFEIPLLEALDHYKLVTADRLVAYEKSLHEQSSRIRKTEAENLKVGRRRKRDLQQFRQALTELQRQVDELDAIKAEYHEEVLAGEDEIWDSVLGKVAFVVRSQLDFYEKVAGKASDPVLEPLISSIPDPFDSYGPPKEDGQIISVLAPLNMIDTSPKSPRPGLSRTQSSSGTSTPDKRSSVISPFPTTIISPSRPETSTILALGESRWSEDGEAEGRARRELSVIDERDTNSVLVCDPAEVAAEDDQAETGETEVDGRNTVAANGVVPVVETTDPLNDPSEDVESESSEVKNTSSTLRHPNTNDSLDGTSLDSAKSHSRQGSLIESSEESRIAVTA